MVRKPTVAGSFYPANASALREMISAFMEKAKIENNEVAEAIAFVAPHAGYVYSGPVAAYTYRSLLASHAKKKFHSLIIIGPNHTGYGSPLAVSLQDWETPLGLVKNDVELSKEIINNSEYVSEDETAHAYEHSIEVQLPFIQSVVSGVRCVFVCMGDQSYEASEILSRAILDACKKLKRSIAVIASSDFDHYEPASVAKGKDMPAIEAIERLDTRRFNEILTAKNDTACGHGPITVAALFAKEHGSKKGRLLRYANSGDVTKDYDSVVAYASIVF